MDGGTNSASAGFSDAPVGISTNGVQIVLQTPCPMRVRMQAFSVNLTSLTFAGGHAEGDEIKVQRDAFDPDGPDGDGTGYGSG